MADNSGSMSYLERSLTLSTAGGIYFAGARAETDPRQIVLFIGLGGTGAAALIRIKNQASNRMKLPMNPDTHMPTADIPSNLAFLALDTDSKTPMITYGNTRFADYDREFCSLGVSSNADAINFARTRKNQGAEEYQWIDDALTAQGGNDGAGGIRQLGRLLLVQKEQSVVSRIRNSINQLAHANNQANSLKIFVFAGISGGTGAGTFVDMGYILKKIGRETMSNCTVLGYFVMPDVNEKNGGDANKLRSNAFAGLKELDYLLDAGKKDAVFHQKYGVDFTVDIQGAPYDHCHLVNAADEAGHQFPYNKALNTIAESVFAYVSMDVGGGDQPAVSSLYDNVSEYLRTNSTRAPYPANNRYLALGSASLKIPYTEITTLLACRMFQRLSGGVFTKRPTQESFNRDLGAMGYGEQAFLNYIAKENPPAPSFTRQQFSWSAVFEGNDRAYETAYQYLTQCQVKETEMLGKSVGELEGRFRDYIKTKLMDPERGPIYLSLMTGGAGGGDKSSNLLGVLRAAYTRFYEVSNACVDRAQKIQQEMKDTLNEGRSAILLGKNIAVDKYLLLVQKWVEQEGAAHRYERMAEMTKDLILRLEEYYKKILKPLADVLAQVTVIFNNNLTYLVESERKANKEGRDPSVLIYPLEFEVKYRRQFNDCVDQATGEFFQNLADNLRYWIGREIDRVDDGVASGEDVAGFLSKFISDCFDPLYQSIALETIMDGCKGSHTLNEYIQHQVHTLMETSYPMIKSRSEQNPPVNEFAIFSIPVTNTRLMNCAQAFIAQQYGQGAIVKPSTELNRMSVVKVTAGYPLYNNISMNDLEVAYQRMRSTSVGGSGLHLRPGWAQELASPNIEAAWTVGYSCPSTAEWNRQQRAWFDQCVEASILREDRENNNAYLILGDENVDLDNLQLTGTTRQKQDQLRLVKQNIWNLNVPTQRLVLQPNSTFLLNNENESGNEKMSGTMLNIRENSLRDPVARKALKRQVAKLDRLAQIQWTLEAPAVYARVLVCQMLQVQPGTRNIYLYRNQMDPNPVMLFRGFEYDGRSPEFHYTVYRAMERYLNEAEWRAVIDDRMNIQMQMNTSPEKLDQYVKVIFGIAGRIKSDASVLKQQALTQVQQQRAETEKVIDFYSAVFEECARLYENTK